MHIPYSKVNYTVDPKHDHKYGSAKFQPNPLFSSQQMATESEGSTWVKNEVRHGHFKSCRIRHEA